MLSPTRMCITFDASRGGCLALFGSGWVGSIAKLVQLWPFISYNWLFLCDYAFHKWGRLVLITGISGHNCKHNYENIQKHPKTKDDEILTIEQAIYIYIIWGKPTWNWKI